jgi:hypothetical protein
MSADNETRIQIVCDEEERSEDEKEGNATRRRESMTKFWLVSTVASSSYKKLSAIWKRCMLKSQK